MTPRPFGVDHAAAIAWMQAHPERLRELLEEESAPGSDGAADSDGAIRAHLRFLAAALEAAGPPELEGLADALPGWFEDGRDLYEHHLELSRGAIALEEHLQHRVSPGTDPSLDAALDRRARVGAWTRLFLLAVEERLGPAADGVAEAAGTWMTANQRRLAGYVLAIDRRGRSALGATPGSRADRATLEEVAGAATVQGHLRFTLDALVAALAGAGGPGTPQDSFHP